MCEFKFRTTAKGYDSRKMKENSENTPSMYLSLFYPTN